MTDHLRNITLYELFKLQDPSEYEALLYLKPKSSIKNPNFSRKPKSKSHYNATPFEELTYSEVVEMRSGINGSIEQVASSFKTVFGIEKKGLMKIKVKEFYPAFNHILQETKRLIEAENSLSEADTEWKRAGGDQLAEFREAASLILLAQQFGTTPQEVEQWKYGVVFMIMKWNYLHGRVTKEYHRIKSQAK